MTSVSQTTPTFRSLVPARLDRLPWTRFHWRVILGLGAAWILDGLEIQIVATVGTVLQDKATLHLTAANYRGRTDIALTGTYWAGAMIGAAASIFLLNPNLLPIDVGWRIGFFIGPVLGLIAIYLRYVLPESPRWLMTHGRNDEAEKIVDEIEAHAT